MKTADQINLPQVGTAYSTVNPEASGASFHRGKSKQDYSEWQDCYGVSWKGIITDGSFAHPAKFSKALIERIFDHCLKRGWLKRGEVVGDCFGGIGSGGIIAAYHGLRWVGVELEPKFVKFAQDNFKLHFGAWSTMMFPRPEIIQGDSRRFHELVACSGVVTSPPYNKPFSQDHNGTRGGGRANGTAPTSEDGAFITYGQTAGQIEGLSNGTVDAVVSSPPYAHIAAGAGGLNTKPAKDQSQQSGRKADSASQTADQRYGQSDGQIAGLKEGDVDAIVTSPPYADSVNAQQHGIDWDKCDPKSKGNRKRGEGCQHAKTLNDHLSYGKEDGQIGALKSGEIDVVVTSPPFTQGYKGGGGINVKGYGDGSDKVGSRTYQGTGADREEGNIEVLEAGTVDGVVTSPPYISGGHHADQTGAWNTNGRGMNNGNSGMGGKEEAGYGKTDGQIGQLKGGTINENDMGLAGGVLRGRGVHNVVRGSEKARRTRGGDNNRTKGKSSTGNDSNIPQIRGDAGREAVLEEAIPKQMAGKDKRLLDYAVQQEIGKPVLSEQDRSAAGLQEEESSGGDRKSDGSEARENQQGDNEVYSESLGLRQTGELHSEESQDRPKTDRVCAKAERETYWEAMFCVYSSCHKAIKPGGLIVVIVKDYVQNKKIVPLCDDTARLLEHCGFQIVERVHAMLTKETRHGDLFDGETVTTKSRKSFFRRLAEKKGSPKIDFEEVLFAKKP